MADVQPIRRGQNVVDYVKSPAMRGALEALAEMWDEYSRNKYSREDEIAGLFTRSAVVEVRNQTGGDLAEFSVVQLSTSSMIDSADNLVSFKQTPSFNGIVPTTPPDLNRWAVLAQPLGNSLFGRAVLAGAVACKVLITDLAHTFASPVAGVTDYLQSGLTGSAVILTSPSAPGLQWCQVAVGRCCVGNASTSDVAGICCDSPCVTVDLSGLSEACQDLTGSSAVLYLQLGSSPSAWRDLSSNPNVQFYFDCTSNNLGSGLTYIFAVRLRDIGQTLLLSYVTNTIWDCESPLTLDYFFANTGCDDSPPAHLTIEASDCAGFETSGDCPGCEGVGQSNSLDVAFSGYFSGLGTLTVDRTSTEYWLIYPLDGSVHGVTEVLVRCYGAGWQVLLYAGATLLALAGAAASDCDPLAVAVAGSYSGNAWGATIAPS